jgi:hypothetical protein
MDRPIQPSKSLHRKDQTVQRGIGHHFVTPKRKRTWERKQQNALSYGRQSKLQCLDATLDSLYQRAAKEPPEEEEEVDQSGHSAGYQPSGTTPVPAIENMDAPGGRESMVEINDRVSGNQW